MILDNSFRAINGGLLAEGQLSRSLSPTIFSWNRGFSRAAFMSWSIPLGAVESLGWGSLQ